jgi:ubiquinone/menaquinone biosynthesis C-methylase UbiE
MGYIHDFLFGRDRRVCPWYCCSIVSPINFIRRLVQDPKKILSGFINSGDTVIDIGPGQGFFTFPMAEMVGKDGKIVAIDIQEKMLLILERQVKKAGLENSIHCKLIFDTNYGFNSEVDFVLAFWMVHEVPDKKAFLNSICTALKPNGKLLIAEPSIHVTRKSLEETLALCETLGLRHIGSPKIFFSRSIVLQKE